MSAQPGIAPAANAPAAHPQVAKTNIRRDQATRWGLFLVALIIYAVAFWLRENNIIDSPLATSQVAGEFGDYIGGVTNPIVALFALAALLESINLQQQELSDTRRELSETRKAAQDQAAHFGKQAALDDLNRAAGMLQKAIDSAEAEQVFMSVARLPRFKISIKELVYWILAWNDGLPEVTTPNGADTTLERATRIASKQIAGKNTGSDSFKDFRNQAESVAGLCGSLGEILTRYTAIEPRSALVRAYQVKYSRLVKALLVAGFLDAATAAPFGV